MIKPESIHLHKQSKTLEIGFSGVRYILPAEFLRVHSPSAEVRGHGVGQEVLVYGKIQVGIRNIAAAGNYGLYIHFDDGHDSGIFSWAYLHELGQHQATRWQTYCDRLDSAQKQRDPNTTVVQLLPPSS